MKHLLMIVATVLLVAAGGRDLRVLVLSPTPVMHCEKCEETIKSNLRFEKGVVKIVTDREHQTVAITYNPAKTTPDKIRDAMKKIGRDTRVVSDEPLKPSRKKQDAGASKK